MESSAIRTVGLSKVFGDVTAVDNLNLSIEKKTFFGLLGRNGAGKSTTISMLTGTLRPTEGKIFMLDRPLDPNDPWFKTRMGVVSEEPSLFSRLSGHEQLLFAGRMFGLTKKESQRRADILLEMLRLKSAAKTLICDYSRGMKKKLAIGCALIHAPQVLFLDEPFEGVDATSAATIRLVLEEIAKGGATIMLTTHILEVAQKLCHRIAIVHEGKLAYESTMDDLLKTGKNLEEVFGGISQPKGSKIVMPDWLTN